MDKNYAWEEDADECNGGPKIDGYPPLDAVRLPQEYGKIEVRSRKRLRNGKADKKIPRADPAFCNNIFSKQWDDHRSSAKDDRARKVEIRKEPVEERRVRQDATENHNDSEGNKEGCYNGSARPSKRNPVYILVE